MALNFNTNPYWDDFDPDKNYHRILFKPGYAVQARELTQMQTILQDQISKFAANIFQKNTPITGASITVNTQSAYYLQLVFSYNSVTTDVSVFEGQLIQNTLGDVVARVVAVADATGTDITNGDPPTLVVTYLSGGAFNDGDIIYVVGSLNTQGQVGTSTATQTATGLSSTVSISYGVFYVVTGFNISPTSGQKYSIGNFVTVLPQTTILDKYDNTPTIRAGLNVVEGIYDYVDDPSLLDQADGAPNYQGPGADRYQITLNLETRPVPLGNDDGFIELIRLAGGQIQSVVDGTVYSVINDYIAKRTYDTNGDYVVNDFKITTSANTISGDTYDLNIGKGVAYVRGYRLENQSTYKLTSDRARVKQTILTNPIATNYGNYLYVNGANGVFDVTHTPMIYFHSVDSGNIVSTSANAFFSTVAGTGIIRGLQYNSGSGLSTNTYVYKAYVSDFSSNTISANATTGGTSTVALNTPLFSAHTGAYNGVQLTVDGGPSAGDVRKVVSWDGSTKTATVDVPFSTTVTTNSIITLRFAIKDVECLVATNTAYYPIAFANVAPLSKDTGYASGNTFVTDTDNAELLFKIDSSYIANTWNSNYETTQMFRSVTFTNGYLNLDWTVVGPGYYSIMNFASSSPSDYIIVKQNGQVVPINNVSIVLTNANKSANIITTGIGTFTGTLYVKAFVNNGSSGLIQRKKNLVLGNTANVFLTGTNVVANVYVDTTNAQTYIKNGALVTPGNPQSLYVSDIKRIIKIIDTGNPATAPTLGMLANPTYDVTHNFSFNNGQKDSYYDHGSVTLLRGHPKIVGNMLVIYDYYSQTGGDGYFSVDSYLTSANPEIYPQIPVYTSSHGTVYPLRDTLDFRPTRQNANAQFSFYYVDSSSQYSGSYLPLDNSEFIMNYTYYQGRKDKLVLSKDSNFQVIEGTPSDNPTLPTEPDGSLVIANLTLDPYTAYVPGEIPGIIPNLSIEKVKHKRWTMKDISDMETRINNIEYYTALNTLESSAAALQVPDANGINRFKNGIMVDDFSSFATADTGNIDFNAAIIARTKQLTASHNVDNFALQNPYVLNTLGQISDPTTVVDSFGNQYKINTVNKASRIYSLPYTIANVASQVLASNTINVNPFAAPIFVGNLDLTPSVDNWVDNTQLPDLVIVDPNLQLFAPSNTVNVLNTSDWKVIPGTTSTATTTSTVNAVNHDWSQNWGFGLGIGSSTTTTTTATYSSQAQNVTLGNYTQLPANYTTNGYITDISIEPYIRPQDIQVNATGLAINTPIHCWFDGVNVDRYMTNPDTIELTNISGGFNLNDVIGMWDNANNRFNLLGTASQVYKYPGTANARLYLSNRFFETFYGTSNKLVAGRFDAAGNFISNTAFGYTQSNTQIITVHNSGTVASVGGTFVDANTLTPQTISTKKVTSSYWCSFLNTYGVWFTGDKTGNAGQGGGEYANTITYSVNFPSTGNYTLTMAVDDEMSVQIESTFANLTSYVTSNFTTTHTFTYTAATAGTKLVKVWARNVNNNTNNWGQNPAAFGMTITSPTGAKIFDTVSYTPPSLPAGTATMTQMYGGGVYYTGVTQVTLSSLASNTANYYIGSTISIQSTNITKDPTTGKAIITPSSWVSKILTYDVNTKIVTISTPINCSVGFNSYVNGDVTSIYSMNGTQNNYIVSASSGTAAALCTDASGSFSGIFHLPANTFRTGDRIFLIDNRTVAADPSSATTSAQATFTASGLATKSQAIDFSPSVSALKGTFTQTNVQNSSQITKTVSVKSYDPLAQSFLIDATNYPNGVFIDSVKLFFQSKPLTTSTPITLSIVGTLNGYPNGQTLDNSIVTLTPDKIQVSTSTTTGGGPHYLDPTTYTTFKFPAPVYIQSGVLYSLMLVTQSTEYNVWIAAQNATAVPSSVKNLPTDPTPSVITRIGTAPYIGSLFESQNALTWTAEQGKALMFVMDRCKFNIGSASIPFVVPKNLPYRKNTVQDVRSAAPNGSLSSNNVSNINNTYLGYSIVSDAYNLTTTDFVPSSTSVGYSYTATLASGGQIGPTNVTPGKYGCPTYDDIYLADGNGERYLDANVSNSFTMYATISTTDNAVSPVISDDGLTVYNIRWNINNLPLNNSSITIVSGGDGYNVANISVSVSAPDDVNGVQANAGIIVDTTNANTISSIYFDVPGSGYASTPTITIVGDNASGNDAVIIAHGETDAQGGNALTRYFTKKVVLGAGNASGDLRVFYTAYRPYGTNVYVYYKIHNEGDPNPFETGNWQLMTLVSGQNSYSTSRDNVIEFEAAPGIGNVADNAVSYADINGNSYTSFTSYAIKVVLSTKDNTIVPFLTDIRTLALPPGTGF